jgi:hypothetical protein
LLMMLPFMLVTSTLLQFDVTGCSSHAHHQTLRSFPASLPFLPLDVCHIHSCPMPIQCSPMGPCIARSECHNLPTDAIPVAGCTARPHMSVRLQNQHPFPLLCHLKRCHLMPWKCINAECIDIPAPQQALRLAFKVSTAPEGSAFNNFGQATFSRDPHWATCSRTHGAIH